MYIRNMDIIYLNGCKMSVSQKLGCNSKDAMERKKITSSSNRCEITLDKYNH